MGGGVLCCPRQPCELKVAGGVSYNVVLDNHVNSRRVGGFISCHLQPCRIRTLIGMGGGVPFVMDKHVDSRWSYWQPRRF